MLSEDFETVNYISEDRDQFTQTSTSSVLYVHQPPLPRDINDKTRNKVNTVFEYCQIIQDPDYPKSVTIVKEFVTEEVKDHSLLTGESSKASRYKYTREVIHPFFTAKSDPTEPCEVLIRDALRSAKKDFPDFYPSLEVYHSQKSLKKTNERVGESSLISKVNAQTSYYIMDPDPDKVCLSDCSQAEDPKKCKQACKELNEARKSETPKQKPPCGKPVHKPPKCEKAPNCIPKIKKVCSPKSSSSNYDKNQDQVLITDLNTNKNLDINSDEVIVTDLNTNKELNNNPDEVLVTDLNTNNDLNKTPDEVLETVLNSNIYLNVKQDIQENKADLGNIVPNIIFESDSSSEKSFADAHERAMSTIKVAMEDFIEIVYKTTQDAVSLIATESAKALAKIKASEAANTNIQLREKELENKSSERVKTIGFFSKDNEEPEVESNPPGPATKVIDSVLKAADSVLCVLGDKITKSLENLPKKLGKSIDTSSPYDQSKIDDKPAHIFTPDATNGVFSALKNKIYSIFSDTEPKTETPVSRSSSASLFSFKSDDDKK